MINNFMRGYRESEIFTYTSAEELVGAYVKKGVRFDIVFLDVKIKKMSGVEAAKIIRGIDNDVLIIFVTANISSVFEGYEVRAFRYILKPYSQERIKKELGMALKELSEGEKRYTIYTKSNIKSYIIDEIMYLESFRRQVRVVTVRDFADFYSKLSIEEEKLRPYGFLRVHQSYLINMAYIKTIIENNIYLTDNTVIPISKNRKKEALACYTKYLTEFEGI